MMTDSDNNSPVKPMTYVWTSGVMIAIVWGLYVLEHFTDIRIGSGDDPLPILIPIIATPVIAIGGFIMYRRALGIVAHGIEVEATIGDIGRAVEGMRHVTYEYEFRGVRYAERKSVGSDAADELSPGDKIRIIVDDRKPKRFLVPD